MGEGESTTIHACWRTIRNWKEMSAKGVDGGPGRLRLMDRGGMEQTILPRRSVPYLQSTSQIRSKSRACGRGGIRGRFWVLSCEF